MRITYDYGEAHVPTAYAGRIVLTFDSERAVVDLVQEKDSSRRAWAATLPVETWKNLVSTLERYEFPKDPNILEPPVPGSLSTTITADIHGRVESVLISGVTTDYSDVNRIAWAIVAQMAPELVRGDPKRRAFPQTRVEQVREVSGPPQ